MLVSASRRAISSSVSETGISSGTVTMTTPVWAGSVRMSIIQSVWLRTTPTLTRSLIATGAAKLTDDVSGGRRVDHHEVVVVLPHLPGELADRQDLLDARSGVRHEVERVGQRPDPGQHRHLHLEPQVLLQRLLGVHRHREQTLADLGGLERQRADPEEVGQVPLRRRSRRPGSACPASPPADRWPTPPRSCRPRPCP